MSESALIMGISSSHNGSVCLLRGLELIVAVQEERLSGVKRERLRAAERSLAVEYCLEEAGVTMDDVSMVVVASQARAESDTEDFTYNRQLRARRGNCQYMRIGHHAAHAWSAFCGSGFSDAAVLVLDGLGSPGVDLSAAELRCAAQTLGGSVDELGNASEIASIYRGTPQGLQPLEKVLLPGGKWLNIDDAGLPSFASIGGMYSAVSHQIFGDGMDAGKVMGLAPYGRPKFGVECFYEAATPFPKFNSSLSARFGHARRWPSEREEYQDLAASVQQALESFLVGYAEHALTLSGSSHLCYAGGVALNSVANERLASRLGRRFYVVPAADDGGPALGAAYYGAFSLLGRLNVPRRSSDALGRRYSRTAMKTAIVDHPYFEQISDQDVEARASEILSQGHPLAWCDGGSEFGPRALGSRSLLFDPRRPEGKDFLNSIKQRESFRPFAPAVLAESASEWFEMGEDVRSPFMLRVCSVRRERQAQIPTVVHVDGTARVQTVDAENTPRFHHLISEFAQRTGVPILVNTSLNLRSEPIAETPSDALWTAAFLGVEYAMIGPWLVRRKPGLESPLDLPLQLAVEELESVHRVDRGRLSLTFDPKAPLSTTISTPWGRKRVSIHANTALLLAAIEPASTGRELLAKMQKRGLALDEKGTLDLVACLRRRWLIRVGTT